MLKCSDYMRSFQMVITPIPHDAEFSGQSGIKEGDPKVQFHKDKLINSKLFMVIDIAESLITILKRSLTRLFYSLNLQSVISLKI